MLSDTIRYAELDGCYFIEFIGDIRVTLCASFDDFIEGMFSNHQLHSIALDLRKARNIDSTALGMIAKIAARSQAELSTLPTVISNNDDINRTLECMGLLPVLNMMHDAGELDERLKASVKNMPLSDCSAEQMCEKVIQAHKSLMALSANNEEIFKDLVSGLEEEKSSYQKTKH